MRSAQRQHGRMAAWPHGLATHWALGHWPLPTGLMPTWREVDGDTRRQGVAQAPAAATQNDSLRAG